MTRAVRFQGPGPGIRIGRLEDDAVWDAGAAPAVGFAPTAGGLGARARGLRRVLPARPGHAARAGRAVQADLHRPQLPPARRGDGRVHPERARRLLQAAQLLLRTGRCDRAAEGRAEPRLRGRDGARHRHAHPPRRPRGGARGDRRRHRAQRRLRAQGPAQLGRSVRPRQELRHVRAARPVHHATRASSIPTTSSVRIDALGRDHAGLQHVGHDLRRRGPDRLRLGGHHARAWRRDRHRHAERRRHGTGSSALAARRRRLRGRDRGASGCSATPSSPRPSATAR